jgi:DNA-directed RNA polymerase specialized sigma24 family protein
MDEQDCQEQIDADILRLTSIKSRQLAGKYGFASYDAEDIQQDLLLDYLRRLPSFNAHRCSRRTFARLVVHNRVSTLIAERKAGCRDYRACRVSVDQPLHAQNPYSGDTGGAHLWVADPNTGSLFETRLTLYLDVEQILTQLPGPLVSLCRLLMVCETSSEAAARSGISRATLYRRIQQVRAEFDRAGLDN